ncbi:hypothetical protein CALVIDRAFT_506233 [Calocera viscosa TUFC12733]|uniref:Uncharacterized protein n=1 Tax=Calocera viscosa (strain TUFC12733) TaxID=1330018 RepID=A0A167GY16_CALVF|nr:hypothetical protein CALVIDRAFT_506233 [Calocera viscosa TUFC12733]
MYPNGVADILNSISVPAQYPTPARIENLLNPCDCNRGGACYCCTPRHPSGTKRKPRRRSPQSSSPLSTSASASAGAGAGCGGCGDTEMADAAVGGIFAAATGSSPESGGCTGSGSAEEGCGPTCGCRNSEGQCGKPCCRPSAASTRTSSTPRTGATPRLGTTPRARTAREQREESVTGEATMYAEMALAELNGSARTSVAPVSSSQSTTPTQTRSSASSSTPPTSLSIPPYEPYVPPHHAGAPTSAAQILAATAELIRCSCGWACACPGCAEHNPSSAGTAYDLCPELCTNCIDCAAGAYSLPHFLAHPSPQPQESVDAFLARQALAYGLPPAPPSRAGAARLSSYSGSTFVLPFSALSPGPAARASGVGSIRKLCCAGACACEEGRCGCAEGCGGGAGEGGCAEAGHNAAAGNAGKQPTGSCCSSKSHPPSASPTGQSWPQQPLPTSYIRYPHSPQQAASPFSMPFSPPQHAHEHVPFGAFQQSLAAAGLQGLPSQPQGGQAWGQ